PGPRAGGRRLRDDPGLRQHGAELARIVVLSVPAYGHLNPVLPIVRRLVQRGHDVTVFNETSFGPLIAATGARFVAYPPVIHLEDFSRTLKDGDMIAWIHMILHATDPLLRATESALRANQPDLLVFDGVALWGEMLAIKLGLPSVSISTTFMSDAFRRSVGEVAQDTVSIARQLAGLLLSVGRIAGHGVPSIPHRLPLVPRRGDVTLMMTSREFHPPSRRRDEPDFVFVGCAIDPGTRTENFDFGRLDGRPLLYVSLGTLHHGHSTFFDTCIAAFADFPGQVLLSVGRGTDLGRYAKAPSHFIFAEAVPQLAILERTAVFLTHGGLNSVHEALWHGVPMVAVPQQIEQLNNSNAMAAAGAGLVIDADARGADVTAADLRRAVEVVLKDREAFAVAAARVGDSLRAGGGIEEAANIIEREATKRSGGVQRMPAKSAPTERA
ncbi:MAG TPA: nucleotide disphospho-sugar-binding domain-containing protein, partial [Devosia sp.]|nr:nucleotide disphospho-sugar-binding domain-containing protein [Devosia sp.]